MISMPNPAPDLADPDTVPAVRQVDRDSPEPLAEQAERTLRDAIASGELHGRIPDENTLATDLGVSRKTVRTALAALHRDGLIIRWPRRGTWVKSREP
jgi:DNA-binding GntR family transcriptional regulator